jgi:hypothetical protein
MQPRSESLTRSLAVTDCSGGAGRGHTQLPGSSSFLHSVILMQGSAIKVRGQKRLRLLYQHLHWFFLSRPTIIVRILFPKSCSSGQHSCLTSGRSRKPATLTDFLWFYSFPPCECLDGTLKLGHGCSLYILPISSFAYHPFIWRYLVWVTEKASLNKLQINRG